MKEEERQMWLAYQAHPTVENRNRLVERYVRFVGRNVQILIEKKKIPLCVQTEDLMQWGYIGLLRCVERFDVSKGFEFSTFAYERIRGSVLDGLRSFDWVPRLIRVQNSIAERNGEDVKETYAQIPFSYLDEESKDRLRLLERFKVLRTQDPLFIEAVDLEDFFRHVMNGLNKKEKRVIELYYFRGLTMGEIGALLGVSESRVCQIHSEAIKRMARAVKEVS